MVWSENAQFDSVLPTRWTAEQRARFVAPWFAGPNSADVPWRPGNDEVRRLYPGQSSLTVTAGAVEVGAATENQWWGPGIRSAILFSNNAAGFPHLFLRSGRPLRTFLGDMEGRWLVGGLEASDYAPGRDDENDGERSLSALGVTLRPAVFPALTLGIARTVMSPVDDWGGVAGRFADVLGHWDAGRDTTGRAAEQMTALSARLVAPGDGAEVYFEWARRELPTSFRDLLLRPEHTQGYTIGGQVARPLGSGLVRLQAEHTYLEQSPTETTNPAGSFYASERIPQGYTNNGEVLGAFMGPGASGQWLAADWVTRGVEAGLFGGRVRWADDAYFAQPGGPNRYLAHDMTAYFGARLGVDVLGARLSAEWTANKRWNYLFQSTSGTWADRDKFSVDVMNRTLRLGLSASPRLGRAR
nr:capsule assembly Wzi family protein [Longimicrobium terrae]